MSIELTDILPGMDINYLIKNPASTFYGRVKGVSMKDAGIDNEDLLVIDKSLEYKHGAIAVCVVNGDFTLKWIEIRNGKVFLVPANPDYEAIEVNDDDEFAVWGVVAYVVKKAWG